ncbi:primase-helicase family protein [Endozoicomonas ascidiicola]|uniref:primase-helicase family protein n=1 Tax=Endozoicomonas ascidiicola TaxID=1698521 RepID=UPI00082C9E32|nr:primase-helicase family protein [Endozoicomonas ascidiicola]
MDTPQDEQQLWFMLHSYGNRLAKYFNADGTVDSFPASKMLDSRRKTVPMTPEGLREKHRLMRIFGGDVGGAMMKGPLIKELDKESRSGKTNTGAPTRTLVFDLDDLEVEDIHLPDKMNAASLQIVSERIIQELPEPFRNASYIATASSSFGIKKESIGLHLDFWLKDEISPRNLKEYLTWQNFELSFFEEQLDINGSGTSLSYRIDPCMAENSRMLFIAHPGFADAEKNPFDDNKERIILVEKENLLVDLKGEMKLLSEVSIDNLKEKMLARICKTKNIKPIKKVVKPIKGATGHTMRVVTNPANRTMTFKYDHDTYCSFSIMPKDNNAYLVNKTRPAVVYSMLPDEEPFLFEVADPEGYRWFTEEYLGQEVGEFDPKKSADDQDAALRWEPVFYLERRSDQYHYGMYSKKLNQLKEVEITGKMDAIESWYQTEGYHKPENIPFAEHRFEPDNPVRLDLEDGFVNTFEAERLYYIYPEIDAVYHHANHEDCVEKLQELCPTIYKLIRHAVNCPYETPRFINWLAVILKLGKKTGSSYLLHGTTGTGKGLIYEKILMGLLSPRHVQQANLDLINEKHNDFVEQCLVLVFDEFRLGNSSDKGKINNKLKSWTTENTVVLRKMNRGAKTVPNHMNIIYLANDDVPVEIRDNDRRVNICPRQELQLLQVYPDWPQQVKKIDEELPDFSTFMKHFDCDLEMARLPAKTDARQSMIEMAKTSTEEFGQAINAGDLMYFAEILNIKPNQQQFNDHGICKNVLLAALRDVEAGNESKIFTDEWRAFYQFLIGPSKHGTQKFGSVIKNLCNQQTKTLRRKGQVGKGLAVTWKINDLHLAMLKKQFGNSYDRVDFNPNQDRAMPE